MWAERGIRSWAEGWWASPMHVGDQIGRIVGAPAGSTVMQQNVAIAEAIALSCFRPVDPVKNRVVYERANFPSVRYLYQAQPDLEVVVCEDGDEIVERIDERTLLVPISHVLFKESEIQDVEPIVRRAHEVGAHVILDCYQSAGIVPVDVTALGVDFAVGGSVKWLCGGPANGWLYVRPDLAERLEPTYTGWQAHERPFAFEEEMEYASGSVRFLTGTPNPAAHMAGTAGLRPDRGDRCRSHPRELAPADAAAHRPRGRGRNRGATAVGSPSDAEAPSSSPSRRVQPSTRSSSPVASWATSARVQGSGSARITSRRTTSSASRSARSWRSSRRARSSVISARRRSTSPLRTVQGSGPGPDPWTCPRWTGRPRSSYDHAGCPCKRARSFSRRSSRPSRRRSSSRRCCPRSFGSCRTRAASTGASSTSSRTTAS